MAQLQHTEQLEGTATSPCLLCLSNEGRMTASTKCWPFIYGSSGQTTQPLQQLRSLGEWLW